MPQDLANQSQVRIGIDVGGTFTHAVAIDSTSFELLGKVKVPTSHTAAEGVARGIIDALLLLLKDTNIAVDRVGFIAHSTTQATNAILEGDVAPVGILGMGHGANAILARSGTNLGAIELAPGRFMKTYHKFIDTSKPPTEATIKQAIEELLKAGARAIAISEAFSVDSTTNEELALAVARSMGLLATAGHEVSQLYGLKVRTRTAVINAAMLPKMIESADMTEKSVREAGIKAPIMIMRSDGGVMDIDSMRKKPIQTMLSGPAAGVSAAMMFLRISDGIFLEVGGTSTDVSAIKDGRALVKSGRVGRHRVYMRTLDVRALGIGGGSIVRSRGKQITDVGPRSAHIAQLKYAAFSEFPENATLEHIKPIEGDPDDYLAFAGSERIGLTTTCAANLAGMVPEGDCARGNLDSIRKAFEKLSKELEGTPEQLAETTLDLASKKVIPVVKELVKEYKLDPQMVTLIGGGGGCASIVPYLAKVMGMRHMLAKEADVISAIGVALSLVRETVERQIINPTPDDILRVRQEALTRVSQMGVDAATAEVHIELDSKTGIVRATACGATNIAKDEIREKLDDAGKLRVAADSIRADAANVELICNTENFSVYQAKMKDNQFFGLIPGSITSLRILDSGGAIRLQIRNGVAAVVSVSEAEATITSWMEKYSHWGDAGRIIPNILLLTGARIVDLSGLLEPAQVLALARSELEAMPRTLKIVVLAKL